MHIAIKTSAFLVSAIGLAACDGATEPFAFDTTYETFADISTAFAADVAVNVDDDGDLQNPGNVSDSGDFASLAGGSALYNGAIIAEQDGTSGTLIGQLQLEADFDTNRIDGRAGNFIDSTDGVFLGTLLGSSTFTEELGADGNHFTMEMTGSLDNGGGVLDTTLNLEGNFLSQGGDVSDIAGDADIEMTGGNTYEEGGFSASR